MEKLLNEWDNLLKQLQLKEIKYYNLKEQLFDKEQDITNNTDFKELYGKNNAETRKKHIKDVLGKEQNDLKMLELCIENDKRRITYIKELIRTKRHLNELKNDKP